MPVNLQLDGVSLAPHFGVKPVERPRPLIWCYYNSLNEHRVAMRHGDWKVLAKLNGGKLPKLSNLHSGNAERVKAAKLTDLEIYRVSEDIGEARDLAAKLPAALERLSGLLRTAYAELVADSLVWSPGREGGGQ